MAAPIVQEEEMWQRRHTIGLLVLIAVFLLVALFSSVVLSWLGLPSTSMTALWIGFMVLMGVTIVLIGHGITGQFDGFLIDPRNKMSLSRLQLVLWTIVILPAFLAAAVYNFGAGAEDPLNITVPPEVWGLLGISTGSLVGSGIIKSGRGDADPAAVEQAEQDPNPAALTRLKNQQDVNTEAERASVADLFKGELVGSKDHLEVGKVQMFFFTLLVVFAYGKAIAAGFDNAGEVISSLPDLSAGILALLAISHAGYLANKNVSIEPENLSAAANPAGPANPPGSRDIREEESRA
jgi:hypothetical protein